MTTENLEVYETGVPVIDLSDPDDSIVDQIASACSSYGFFQVTNHGIDSNVMQAFQSQMSSYFSLPHETKIQWKRNESNARGFFDDELTKQRRDWKECLDVGVPGSRDWDLPDEDPRNSCLDGFNRFPNIDDLPEFRSAVVQYFQACEELSDRLAKLMAKGLGADLENSFIQDLRERHTSYLRLNYYPPCPPMQSGQQPLGISPHQDAGFLTILIQDDDCHSLQVARFNTEDSDFENLEWVTVEPVPGALTINTGDMAMIWSNGRYRAPLHRVRTDPVKKRYSAPFFYNPGYDVLVEPLRELGPAKYKPCLWGYFRAIRFAGDLTDLGTEIQISDYKKAKSDHFERQRVFSDEVDFHKAFSIEKYRFLLADEE